MLLRPPPHRSGRAGSAQRSTSATCRRRRPALAGRPATAGLRGPPLAGAGWTLHPLGDTTGPRRGAGSTAPTPPARRTALPACPRRAWRRRRALRLGAPCAVPPWPAPAHRRRRAQTAAARLAAAAPPAACRGRGADAGDRPAAGRAGGAGRNRHERDATACTATPWCRTCRCMCGLGARRRAAPSAHRRAGAHDKSPTTCTWLEPRRAPRWPCCRGQPLPPAAPA